MIDKFYKAKKLNVKTNEMWGKEKRSNKYLPQWYQRDSMRFCRALHSMLDIHEDDSNHH